MSTINLGLQCVGLMREKMDDEFEEAHRCNSLKDLRAAAVRNPNFSSTICDSMSHPKVLLFVTACHTQRYSSIRLYSASH